MDRSSFFKIIRVFVVLFFAPIICFSQISIQVGYAKSFVLNHNDDQLYGGTYADEEYVTSLWKNSPEFGLHYRFKVKEHNLEALISYRKVGSISEHQGSGRVDHIWLFDDTQIYRLGLLSPVIHTSLAYTFGIDRFGWLSIGLGYDYLYKPYIDWWLMRETGQVTKGEFNFSKESDVFSNRHNLVTHIDAALPLGRMIEAYLTYDFSLTSYVQTTTIFYNHGFRYHYLSVGLRLRSSRTSVDEQIKI